MNNDPLQPTPTQTGNDLPEQSTQDPSIVPQVPTPISDPVAVSPVAEPTPEPIPEPNAPIPAPENNTQQPYIDSAQAAPTYPTIQPEQQTPIQEPSYPSSAPVNNKKKLFIIIGAVVAVLVVVIIIAFAVLGSNKPNEEDVIVNEQAAGEELTPEEELKFIENTITRKWNCTQYNTETNELDPAGPTITIDFRRDRTFLEYQTNNIANYHLYGTFEAELEKDTNDEELADSSSDQVRIGFFPIFSQVVIDGTASTAEQILELNSQTEPKLPYYTITTNKEAKEGPITVTSNRVSRTLQCNI